MDFLKSEHNCNFFYPFVNRQLHLHPSTKSQMPGVITGDPRVSGQGPSGANRYDNPADLAVQARHGTRKFHTRGGGVPDGFVHYTALNKPKYDSGYEKDKYFVKHKTNQDMKNSGKIGHV